MGLPAIIGGGVGALASALGQRSQNKQQERQYEDTQRQVQDYERRYREYQDMLRGALGGNAAIFGPQTTTSTGTSTMSGSTMPVITPEFQKLSGQMRGLVEGRLARGTSLPPGYRQMLEREIVDAYRPQEAALRNVAAQRGVSPDVLMVGSPLERARAAQMGDVAAKLPLLQRQLQTEDIGLGQALTAAFGRGEKTRSTSSSQSSQTGPANAAAMMQYYSMLAPPSPTILQRPQTQSPWLAGLQGGLQTGLTAYQLQQMNQMFGPRTLGPSPNAAAPGYMGQMG